jgi:hypothetical protein
MRVSREPTIVIAEPGAIIAQRARLPIPVKSRVVPLAVVSSTIKPIMIIALMATHVLMVIIARWEIALVHGKTAPQSPINVTMASVMGAPASV